MYDWIAVALPLTDSTNAANLKIALIGAVGLILAAAVPALLSTREREPKASRELRHDLKTQRDRLQRKDDWNADYIEALEYALMEKGVDPRHLKPPGEPQ
jgi:hypothetical protein